MAQNYSKLSDTLKFNFRSRTHVLIDLETISTAAIQKVIEKGTPLAVSLSSNEHENNTFLNQYTKYYKELIVIDEKEISPTISNKIKIVQVSNKEIDAIILPATVSLKDSIRFNGIEELGKISFENLATISDSLCIHLWKLSGKQPTFIKTNENSLAKVDSIVSSLNSLRKVFGAVTSKDGLVKGVSFKNLPGVIVNGYFSYPLLKKERSPVLVPYKKGYYFSPDVISTTPENRNNNKIFSAIQLEPEFGLTDHFVFDSNLTNRIRKNDAQLLLNNVEIKKDSDKGDVGYFHNRAYIDAGIDSKAALQKSFTISVWIKPTEFSPNNSILGKGQNFVLKLHTGLLTFTMAGIKDYVSRASPITLNKWTHIALVHSELDKELLFYINGKETEKIKLIADYVTSDYGLLIGSNLWEEFFIGYLNDVKIWERELNSTEITSLFQKEEEKSFNYKNAAAIVFVIFIILILFVKRRFKGEKKNVKTKPIVTVKRNAIIPKLDKLDDLENILCFGKLKIRNKEGIDIAEKLSPMLKKVFIIVFLYSEQGEKKGISTKKLTEFLWSGMSLQSAKNTRGTTINNLRTILDSCPGINLIFKNKFWFIEISEDCYCDYHIVQGYLDSFVNNTYDLAVLEVELPKFLKILKGGRLFSSSSDSWLDPFIEKFSNQIIDQCILFTEKLDFHSHGDLVFLLTEVICIYDDLNEQANRIKLQVLIHQGKLSLAYTTYDNFVKLYHNIYKETYSYSFEDMVSKQND